MLNFEENTSILVIHLWFIDLCVALYGLAAQTNDVYPINNPIIDCYSLQNASFY